MSNDRKNSRRFLRTCALQAVVCLTLIFPAAAPSVARAHSNSPADATCRQVTAGILLAEGGWSLGRLWTRVENYLSDGKRLVQMATLGMVLGLWILWWRK